MTVWLLPLTAILPQTSWDLLILPLYTHNLPLAGGIEPPTKGPHSPPPQAAGQPERFSRSVEGATAAFVAPFPAHAAGDDACARVCWGVHAY
jgi:hypothetical protein